MKLRLLSFHSTILLCISIIIVANSCAPAPITYYKPSYPNSSALIEKEILGRWPSGLNKISIPVGNHVTITARISKTYYGTEKILLFLSLIADGVSAQFSSNKIFIKDLESGDESIVKVNNNSFIFHLLRIPATDLISLDETVLSELIDHYEVEIPFELKNFGPQNIQIVFPEIFVNGQIYKTPPVNLTLINRYYVPKGNKYDPAKVSSSTLFELGGLTFQNFSTSLYPFSENGYYNVLNGRIVVKFQPFTNWYFLSEMGKVINNETGEEINFKVDVFTSRLTGKYFSSKRVYQILAQLDSSPLSYKENVEIQLNDKLPRSMLVKLPDLVINGEIFQIKPITFEKTTELKIAPVP
jgi:hypothetical protein